MKEEMVETGQDLSLRNRFAAYIRDLQDRICRGLESVEDGEQRFDEDRWQRPGGGGGITRIIAGGKTFDKGGVNTSEVYGELPKTMQEALKVNHGKFFACGLSLVIHPVNPYVPTVHANWRYFELYDEKGGLADRWFGGGADLTPYYIFPEDGAHFHRTWKQVMDEFDASYYPLYKQHCDEYFVNRHRNNEARGIGGVFYDYIRPVDDADAEKWFAFQRANGDALLDAYLPIVRQRKGMSYGERETEWQEIRRGRYVEFNLVHDRGTLFGLRTNGRIESILMSLPTRARWYYDYQPEVGTPEAELLEYLKPRQWV